MKRNPITHLFLAATLVVASAAAQAVVATSPYSSLYIFGDSLSDNGNNFLALGNTEPTVPSGAYIPTFPYTSGVYSNGPVWVNSFAAGLGLASYAAPSFAGPGGGDYAAGGAKVSADGAPGYPPSLKTQLNAYLSGHAVSSSALYVLAGGGNDVRKTGDDVAADPANAGLIIGAAAAAYAADVATMVGTLNGLGAQHIVVWNVPDLGRTPAALAGGVAAAGGATFISSVFNGALSGALAGQTDVTVFDMFGLVNQIATTGSYLGHSFSNTTQACGFVGNGCDAASALFWDGIHPTAYTHTVLSEAMLAAAVPEPSMAWMLAAGLAVLALRRRRASPD